MTVILKNFKEVFCMRHWHAPNEDETDAMGFNVYARV